MQTSVPRISKLPFICGDVLLVACAAWIAIYGHGLGLWQYVATVAAITIGAWIAVWPFVLEFGAATKLAESQALVSVTDKLHDLDKVSASIARAVAELQQVQQSATQTVTASQHIAEQMTGEARNFGELLSKMNDSEKNHLRLEVEKLRRAEGDWLGVAVRILDHVHALHQAGVRSGQQNVIEQLTHFQHACRETARRVGIVPVIPEAGIPFDARAHQLLDGATPTENPLVGNVLAPGYTFQGQVIRLPVVALQAGSKEHGKPEAQLSLGQVAS